MNNQLMAAASSAVAWGKMTQAEHDEVAKVAAINWSVILKILPVILGLIPGLGALAPIIAAIIQILGGLTPTPPNGGGDITPTPV